MRQIKISKSEIRNKPKFWIPDFNWSLLASTSTGMRTVLGGFMLLRKDDEGVIAVSQPAHAWVSGQLARNWREADFAGVREEVCLAAEQHDIGFLAWEQSPTLNPGTGLPYTFLEMPRGMHLEIWTSG